MDIKDVVQEHTDIYLPKSTQNRLQHESPPNIIICLFSFLNISLPLSMLRETGAC